MYKKVNNSLEVERENYGAFVMLRHQISKQQLLRLIWVM